MKQNKKNNIDRISVNANETILDALKRMDNSGIKLLLVTQESKFQSLLSIGDIQRAIIRNTSIDTPIKAILRAKVRIAPSDMSFEEIKKMMFDFRTECMPVVNKNGDLVEVYFWEELFGSEKRLEREKLDIPVIIMAGGKGTRLKPITNVLPKPLIPIGEKTILEEIINRFYKAGCSKFYLSLNYKAEMIKHYMENLKNVNYHLEYFEEDIPLGTAGSLHLLDGKIDQTFFVTNCDILIDQELDDIFEYHKSNNNEMTVVAAIKNYAIPYGTITTGVNGSLIEFIEKPDITFKINSGVYILEPQLLNEIPQNIFFHITDLISLILKRNGKVGVFPVSEKSWTDIGDWNEYLRHIS